MAGALWPVAVAAALALIVAAAAWLRFWHAADQPPSALTPVVAASAPALDPRRLAVLPFTNISAEAKEEWFADGITEEMITRLSKIPELSVIARTSIIGYKDSSKSTAEIGRELSAGTILEGSVRRRRSGPHHRPAHRRLVAGASLGRELRPATGRPTSSLSRATSRSRWPRHCGSRCSPV